MKLLPVILGLFVLQTTLAQTTRDSSTCTNVYISFDDGPLRSSSYLEDAIRRDSFPVTLFIVGQQVFNSSENYRRWNRYQDNPLVELANHSFSHASGKYRLFYKQPAGVVADILKNEDTLGFTEKIVRLPGRNVWRINGRSRTDLPDASAAADSLAGAGFRIVGWDLEWCFDSTGKTNYTAAHMLELVHFFAAHGGSFTRGNIVILCHDPMLLDTATRKEFDIFIHTLRKDPAFRLRKLNQYPANLQEQGDRIHLPN